MSIGLLGVVLNCHQISASRLTSQASRLRSKALILAETGNKIEGISWARIQFPGMCGTISDYCSSGTQTRSWNPRAHCILFLGGSTTGEPYDDRVQTTNHDDMLHLAGFH